MDTEVLPTATEAVAAPKAPRPRGIVDARTVRGLDLAEQRAQVAKRPEVTAALADEALPPGFADSLLAQTALCRTAIATHLSANADRMSATAQEKTVRLALIGLLQGVQSAAKRQWGRSATERGQLKAYYVGTALKALSFAALAEAADAIVRQAHADNLPGVTPARLATLEQTISAWKGHNTTQSQAQNTASIAQQEITRLIAEITTARIQLQLAADSAFPYTDKANTPLRTEFGLPKNGPYQAI